MAETDDIPSVTMNRSAEVEEMPSSEDVREAQETELRERLTRIEDNVSSENNPTVARLMGDPEIRMILEARQAGRDIKVVDREPESELEDVTPMLDESSTDLDELSNSELSKVIVKETLKAVKGLVQAEVKPISDQIKSTQGIAAAQETRHIQSQLVELKVKYPDLESYGPEMIALSKTSPGLSPEEYYILAKGRAGAAKPPEANAETEHPTNTSARVGPRREVPRGRAGIRGLIRDAASSLDINLPDRPG